MLGDDWVAFARSLNWSRGYRHTIAELVRDELVHQCRETAEQARARIVRQSQDLYKEARLSGEYGPAVGALRLQADILLPKEAEKHLHLHATPDQIGELSDDDLRRIASDPDQHARADH
jgi:hypothetical protein